MERPRPQQSALKRPSRSDRQLAPLKMVSRLLGHELHAQQSPRLTLSRDEVLEIQTTLDLYIENVTRTNASMGSLETVGTRSEQHDRLGGELEVQAVPARTTAG